jgi:hypothetical protein
MKSLKKLMSDTARAPYPTNLSGRNVKMNMSMTKKIKAGKLFTDMCEGLPEKRLRGKTGFVNGMVASHLLCHSGTINRHSLNGALLS